MALFGQNWPKFDLNLANLAGCWNSWISQKNKKVGVFETDFKQVPFVFRQTTCTYSESWRPLENVCDPPPRPVGGGGGGGGGAGGGGEKMTKKIFSGQKFFPLILPKKHSLITQKQFWPFFGVFSGFLGVPQNYIIWLFKSVFWQFLCEKNGRKSRDPTRQLVDNFHGFVHFGQKLVKIGHLAGCVQ